MANCHCAKNEEYCAFAYANIYMYDTLYQILRYKATIKMTGIVSLIHQICHYYQIRLQ